MISKITCIPNCRRNVRITVSLKKENVLIPHILDFLHYEMPCVTPSGMYLEYVNFDASTLKTAEETQ